MTNVLVKIIVEFISVLALATEQVKQGRPSEFVSIGTTLDSMGHSETYEEAPGGEGY